MLNGPEQKLLRVLKNFSRKEESFNLSWSRLERTTGKDKAVLMARLQELQTQGYIVWDGSALDSIEFSKRPEKTQASDRQDGMRYFTEH
ncbi:hypothetical protein CDO73_26300 [Saccharibacillus sp. O23]|uniref:hypothetical protein n=1 Tax=Saccharibacillus sp. O23 TaxID=2009338 RepID=UPI000B4E3FEE|nr:hypothetical protein [Saccharibacillus sp. O23]OWR25691.1 hypothetical protein CDO73_26300 [Saccharibacillus sp. O23]